MNRRIISSILSVGMLLTGFNSFVSAQEPETEVITEQEINEETTDDEVTPEQPSEGSDESEVPAETPEVTETPEETEIPEETEEPGETPGEENTEEPGAEETVIPEQPETPVETETPEETEAPDFVVPEETPAPTEEPKPEEPEIVIEEDESSWQEVWLPPGHIIRSYEDTYGADWTDRPALAVKLDSIFRGYIGLTDAAGNDVIAPLGSHAVLPGLTLWACSRMHTGQSCFIYALGIYYTLFGEDPYLYRDHSEIVTGMTGRTVLSREVLENAGVRNEPGAYVRTLGHSLIVMGYDDEGIDVIQGNVGGDGFICISQYTWEEFNAAIMLNGGTSIEVVYQPTAAYFSRMYPLKEETEEEKKYTLTKQFICGTSSFAYDRLMMMNDENILNPEIAKMTQVLSASVNDEKETRSLYEQMGFENDDVIYEKEDGGYSIAKDLFEYGENPYELIFITVNGEEDTAPYLRGYMNNDKGWHEGFYSKAKTVRTRLNEILENEDEEEKAAQKIYVISGQSSGASAANILAAELTHEINADEENKDRVFSYCYGALPVSSLRYNADHDHGADHSLSNIFNFLNQDDLALNLPSTLFGYKRNGADILLNHGQEDPVYLNFRNRFRNENGRAYRPLSPNLIQFEKLSEEEKKKVFATTILLMGLSEEKPALTDLLESLYGDSFSILPEETANRLIEGIFNEDEECLEELKAAENILEELTKDVFDSSEQEIDEAQLELLKLVFNPEEVDENTDLNEICEDLNQVIRTADYLSAGLLNYLNLFVSEDHTARDLINDTHDTDTYALWINSMYYGDHGWQGFTGKAVLPQFAKRRIYSIGNACFKDASLGGEADLDQIKAIGKEAFRGTSFESLILDSSLENLYEGSFADMKDLKEIILPVNISFKAESDQAIAPFANDTGIREIIYTGNDIEADDETLLVNRPEGQALGSLRRVIYEEGVKAIPASKTEDQNDHTSRFAEVILPSSLENIDENAFKGWNLKTVYIPESVSSIAESAFEDNPDLTLYVVEDSYGEQFAAENEITYVTLENEPSSVSFEKRAVRLNEKGEVKLNIKADPSEIKNALHFESSDESIVSVDENGKLHGSHTGIAGITVSFNDRSDTCIVRVIADKDNEEKQLSE